MTQPPEISDRNLLEQTFANEGSERSLEQFPPTTWRLLDLEASDDSNPLEAGWTASNATRYWPSKSYRRLRILHITRKGHGSAGKELGETHKQSRYCQFYRWTGDQTPQLRQISLTEAQTCPSRIIRPLPLL